MYTPHSFLLRNLHLSYAPCFLATLMITITVLLTSIVFILHSHVRLCISFVFFVARVVCFTTCDNLLVSCYRMT